MQTASESPIGLYDSGVGGLTVFREISRLLPHEDLIYLGDTARLPYGNKSASAIIHYAKECAAFLLKKGIKLLIIACHTASCHALKILEKSLPIPVIGMIRPGLELIQASNFQNIALLATEGTIVSNTYQSLLQEQIPSIHVHAIACPLFVSLAEEGLSQHKIAKQVASHYLHPLRKEPIEAALLACTHYPLLREAIQASLRGSIQIFEPSYRCAKNVLDYLAKSNLAKQSTKKACHKFFTTDSPERFTALASIFLDRPIQKADVALAILDPSQETNSL